MLEDRTLDKLRAQIELALYVDPKLQLASSWSIGVRWSALVALTDAINAPVCSNCTKCDLLNASQLFAELFSGVRDMQTANLAWCRRCGKVGRYFL
jgi:hypothetical protein